MNVWWVSGTKEAILGHKKNLRVDPDRKEAMHVKVRFRELPHGNCAGSGKPWKTYLGWPWESSELWGRNELVMRQFWAEKLMKSNGDQFWSWSEETLSIFALYKRRPHGLKFCFEHHDGLFYMRYQVWLQYCKLVLPGGAVVKNLPTNAGDTASILELGRSPEKEMATDSSILAWEIPWAE